MFMEQTSNRVTERLVIAKAIFFIEGLKGFHKKSNNRSHRKLHSGSWQFTCKDPHLLYDLQTCSASLKECKVYKEPNPSVLLTDHIKQVLEDSHGPSGTVCIWKEIKVALEDGLGDHHV